MALINRRFTNSICICLAAVFVCLFANVQSSAASDELWTAIRGGRAVAMMRHAIAPGGGDPSNFALCDCSTQRNLSEEGREQSRKIGADFKANGISDIEVLTSQWCRCIDTARLLGLGEVAEFPALNSFFQARQLGPSQTEALRKHLIERQSDRPLLLVTHQVNITALTDVFPQSGEIVVFEIDDVGSVTVLGTLL